MRYSYAPLLPDHRPSGSGVALAALGSAACVAATLAFRYQRSRICVMSSAAERLGEDLPLGDVHVGASCVMMSSAQTVAFSGLQPIVSGHCVVAPRRPVARVMDLSEGEWLDLWRTAKLAQAEVERSRGADAANLLLKDGTARLGGHIHAHIVPRLRGDFARNDDIFDAMDGWVPSEAAGARLPPYAGLTIPSDEERKDRTSATMAEEATSYRGNSGGRGAIAPHVFARFPISSEHCFYESESKLTVAFVNLRPLVHGHVLVTPRRIVPRLRDLSAAEADDLWASVRKVIQVLEARYAPRGFELGVQDGKPAGQSVPHVHVHVLPHA